MQLNTLRYIPTLNIFCNSGIRKNISPIIKPTITKFNIPLRIHKKYDFIIAPKIIIAYDIGIAIAYFK